MKMPALAGFAALLLMAAPATAQPGGPVLQVTASADGELRGFDLAALHDLPEITLETSTVVTDGAHRFTGFLVRDLLDRIEATGDQVIATALNDYVVEIPIEDFRDYDVIVAYAMDGAPLDRADKGPLWIVYPRDDHAALQDIRYDYRWVWQLSRLDVR